MGHRQDTDGAGDRLSMSEPSLTLLHTSDFQCGKPFLPEAGDAVVRLARSIEPDIVVSSGDLTQRAKKREFVQARALLDRFGDRPVVVTPGNHDVPLYRFWERLFDPYRNWRRFSGTSDLDTVTTVEGATIVALDSAAPRRAIVAGRIDDRQVDFASRAFASADRDDLRILVIHHHFVPVDDGAGGRPLPGANRLAEAFAEMGVDVVLGGHVHQLHLKTSADIPGGATVQPALPILACGTSASRRGRGVEAGWNSLCVLTFREAQFDVTPYRRAPSDQDFSPLPTRSFPLRRGMGAMN